MPADPEILQRLDLIQATLQLAYSEQLRATSQRLRSDPVTSVILDLTAEEWVSSSILQSKVARSAKVSERTVRNRLVELTAAQVLAVRGGGRPEYKARGLV